MKTEVMHNERNLIPTTSQYIQVRLNLNVSLRTVQRTLKCLDIGYERYFSKYHLSKKCRMERLLVARSYIEDQINWGKVVFSDEKLFTLGLSDGFYTWKTKGNRYFKTKKFLRSPGLMVWAVIFPSGLLSFRIISGKINSEKYVDILKSCLLPMAKLNCPTDYIFQQDNCRIHTSVYTKKFFEENKINYLNWAPYSPDLNIIENIWSKLSTIVYRDGPSKNLRELKNRIISASKEFNETNRLYVSHLYSSMPKRLCDVIERKGDRIKY